jgi:transcriptional regulator with XRE-family HTH domain
MTDVKQKFGEKMLEIRISKGLSQEKFAELLGIDRTYVSGIERGRRNVSLILLDKISTSLSISLSDLLNGM